MNNLMLALFKEILNMSITASAVIIVVILARFLLHRFPKKYSYYLWAIVGVRLIFPFTITSVLSIFNLRMLRRTRTTTVQTLNTISPSTNALQNSSAIAPSSEANLAVEQSQKAVTQSVSTLKVWLTIAMIIWLIGIIVLMIYGLVSYVRLKKQVSQAVKLKENIYECDQIASPFVLGIFRPFIYIPFRLNEEERCYILKHEQFHIYRKDYIIKLISYIITIVYWFNPFVWIANLLMTRDMEMSCDEKVIAEYDTDIKTAYSISLLSFATNRRINMVSPLAFGETDTKRRVRHVLHIKKPKIMAGIIGAFIVCLLGIACLTNGNTENSLKVKTEIQPDGQSILISHTYNLKQQAKSYIVYADVYVEGKKTERKILYGSQLDTDGIYQGQMNLQIYREIEGNITSIFATGGLDNSNNKNETVNAIDNQISFENEPDKYTMYARDILWDNGKKHKFNMNRPYIFVTQYLEHGDAQGIEVYSCDSYNSADSNELSNLVKKNAATILIYFQFSDDNLDALRNTLQIENTTYTKNDSNEDNESPQIKEDTFIFNQMIRWADAFCDRQGDVIVEMSSEEVKNQFLEKDILTVFDDNTASFGYSSPWPIQNDIGDADLPDGLNKAYKIKNYDNNHATILYYAMASDPHYTVWKEELSYEVKNDTLIITAENLTFYDNIVIFDEFQAAYPKSTVRNTWMDYQINGSGKQLNENALLSSSNMYKDLFAPDTAAVSLLNLLKNPNKVSVKLKSQDGDTAKILVHFEEDGVDIEINMIRPYGEHGIWIVDQ